MARAMRAMIPSCNQLQTVKPDMENAMFTTSESFRAEYPQVAAWLETSSMDFAVSLRGAMARYGRLTPRQLEAAQRCATRVSAPKAAGVNCDAQAIQNAFLRAMESGLKRPRLHVGAYLFKPASARGRNPGALYVTASDTGVYLGKIAGGQFYAAYDCAPKTRDDIAKVASDPHAAAVNHGRLTGQCAACNRPLSDPESVARGIGPICATRFGW